LVDTGATPSRQSKAGEDSLLSPLNNTYTVFLLYKVDFIYIYVYICSMKISKEQYSAMAKGWQKMADEATRPEMKRYCKLMAYILERKVKSIEKAKEI
jgi:hypothetical protein